MSKTFVVITADTNDGDYVTKSTEISEEDTLKLKEILAKMPRAQSLFANRSPKLRYETCELGNDDKKDSDYTHISNEEKEFLTMFIPSGDENYPGIHTITEVNIVTLVEKLL